MFNWATRVCVCAYVCIVVEGEQGMVAVCMESGGVHDWNMMG